MSTADQAPPTACEDCNDTGTITDPAPDAPGARPPEPCVLCPRTLPVTPAERACATVLRAYLNYEPAPRDYDGERGLVALIALVETGARNAGLVGKWTTDLTPAGRDLLARVERAERTPASTLALNLVRALRDEGASTKVLFDAAALASVVQSIDAPPAKEPR